MFLLHCSGMGALTVRNTTTGQVEAFATMEAAVVAHQEHLDECAWADPGSARDYYRFDFIWGDAMDAVTVVVGEERQQLTISKPAHRR
jgi:hypothetical protein